MPPPGYSPRPLSPAPKTGEPARSNLSPEEWHACVYVFSNGQAEEIETPKGRELLAAHRESLDYARVLHHQDRSNLLYTHVLDQYRWLLVRITLIPHNIPLTQGLVEMRECAPPFGLTIRELDVLSLLAAGLSNTAIAKRIYISPRTVAKHVENIFEKMTIQNRAFAASQALDTGLIRLPTPGGSMNSPLATSAVEREALAPQDWPQPKTPAKPNTGASSAGNWNCWRWNMTWNLRRP